MLIGRTAKHEQMKTVSQVVIGIGGESPPLRHELLGDYLPWCEVIVVTSRCVCVPGREGTFYIALAGKTDFLIESPDAYRLVST